MLWNIRKVSCFQIFIESLLFILVCRDVRTHRWWTLHKKADKAAKSPSSTQTVFLVWQAEIYCSCLFIYSCIRLTAFLWCCISRLLHIKYLTWVACLADGVIQTRDLFLELKRGPFAYWTKHGNLDHFLLFHNVFKCSCWLKIKII